MPRFIVVTGGVLSGLGKGVLTASIGKLLSRSYRCAVVKCDGYLNVDPGTMNPVEHGEVFVLEDGTECDMDFGHYERFLDVTAKGTWNLTMGKIYKSILEKERKGEYLGKTVQLVPHVTAEIKEQIKKVGKESRAEIVLIEVGGTVGDMENRLYLEALRELAQEVGKEKIMFIHLSYVPIPTGVHEQKSKPTQGSVRELNEIGIWPDVIACRCSAYLTDKIKERISLFCNVPKQNVITIIDVPTVYLLPGELEKQGFVSILKKKFNISFGKKSAEDMRTWRRLAKKMYKTTCDITKQHITIGICGKYTTLEDSYASVVEALHHCAANLNLDVCIRMVDSDSTTSDKECATALEKIDGIIIPGGFGTRGWEGKIQLIKYAREHKLPFLGICLGLQAAVVEYARNVCGVTDANSAEMNSTTSAPVITLMDEQRNVVNKGGTMRLGAYEALLVQDTLANALYNSTTIKERHRHRYEVNPAYHAILTEKGLLLSGLSPSGTLVEFIELPKKMHPYFIATQAHPELQSKLQKPAPLFVGLIKAAKRKNQLSVDKIGQTHTTYLNNS